MPLVPELLVDLFPGLADLPGRLMPSSLDEYCRDLQQYVAWCALDRDPLDPLSLRAWRQWMVEQTRLSPNTITRRLRAIQAAVRASARREALDQAVAFRFSLVEGVPRSALRERLKTFRALTPAQVRRLCLRPDPTTLLGLRDRSLLMTLAGSGVRISEAVALRLGDLAPHGASWSVRVLGKGQDQPRTAPLTTEAQTWITRWVKARLAAGVDTERVFTGFVGRYQWPTAQPLGAHAAHWSQLKGPPILWTLVVGACGDACATA